MGSAFRYCALIWNASDPAAQAHATRVWNRALEALPDWASNLDTPGFRVISMLPKDGAFKSNSLARRSGVVLGTIFPTESAQKSDPIFTEDATAAIVATGGRSLIDGYWGRYLAFINGAEPHTHWVLKDPAGRLPCFVATYQGLTLVFSYMPDAVALGAFPLSIHWGYVESRVARGAGRPGETGIQAVSEVCGGECLEFKCGEPTRRLYWDPTIQAQDTIEDPGLASRLIREQTKSCVHAWASVHGTWLHRLSGGLDSSVVLACLADAPSRPRVACITYCWEGSSSLERPWARMAASHSRVELIERSRTGRMHFDALARMNLSANPPATSSFLELNQTEHELAAQYDATVISTGDGGDSLFGSSAARFSASDFWRRHGLRPALLRHASDVALLQNQTAWGVLARTLRPEARERGDGRDLEKMRQARQLVRTEIREPRLIDPESTLHPWFRSGRVPSSVREILAFIAGPEEFYDPISNPHSPNVDSLFPLLSQPLVELCMRIPSYVHFHQGRDRGLARLAFAGDVPAPILERTWKDRVQGFPEEILRTHRADFRSILLDGLLVKKGYLDRNSVEESLSGNALQDTASVGEIIDHVLVESWLRSWSDGRVHLE